MLMQRLSQIGFVRLKGVQWLCNFNNLTIRRFSGLDVREIKIDVPWGHIAGRHWNGSETSRKPIICLHGWKDNLGSWDRLLPVLIPSLDQYQFLCIDLPGHGLSCHYPPGMVYNLFDGFLWILRIMKNFGWTKVTIVGHSFGAVLGFNFAAYHPTLIHNLVAIDGLTTVVFTEGELLEMIPDITEHLLMMEDKVKEGHAPTYTWDEVLQKMKSSHMMGMNEIACRTMMKRSVVEDPVGSGRFKFSHDIRVHYLPITTIDEKQISFLAKNFQSGLLYIKAGEGVNYMSNYLSTNIQSWIEKDNKNPVKFVRIEKATHHLHLIAPNPVAKHIVDFLC